MLGKGGEGKENIYDYDHATFKINVKAESQQDR